MPEGIHPNTPEDTRAAIIATRERRKAVAQTAAAKRSDKRKDDGPTKSGK